MINKGSYAIYVPNNKSGEKDVIIYFPGDGGASNDAGAMYEYINTNPDKVVLVSGSPYYIDSANIYGALNEVKNSGVNIGSVNILGHSAGQITAVDVAADAKNYGYNIDYVVSLDSAHSAEAYRYREEQAKILAQDGTKLVMFDQRMTPISDNNLQKFTDAGVPIVYVYCSDGSTDFYENHAAINEGTVRDGIIDFICGDSDKIKDSKYFTYNYITYDKSKGQWVSLTKDQAEKLISDGKAVKVGSKISKSGKVVSDKEYANSEMSKLKTKVSVSTLRDKKNVTLPNGSTTTAPNINIETYNSLFAGIVSLNEKITNELNAGIKIAEKFDKLDDNMKNKITNELLNSNAALKSKFATQSSSVEVNLDTLEGRFTYIYNQLTEKYGYSDAGAKAILANMLAEDNTLIADRHQSDDPNQPGYGLCQWEFSIKGGSGRADKMVEYCNANGLDYKTIDGQLAWLDHELSTTFVNYGENLYNDLKTGTDYDYLTKKFCTYYEAPAYNNGQYRAENETTLQLFELLNGGAAVGAGIAASGLNIQGNATQQNGNTFSGLNFNGLANVNDNNTFMDSLKALTNNNNTNNLVNNGINASNNMVNPVNTVNPVNNANQNTNLENANVNTPNNNVANNVNPQPVYVNENTTNQVSEEYARPIIDEENTSSDLGDNSFNNTVQNNSSINTNTSVSSRDNKNTNRTENIDNNQGSGLAKGILTAVGVTAAVGAAAGAVAYGVNKTKENNEIGDEPLDDEPIEEDSDDI